jgi:hypothetical protein
VISKRLKERREEENIERRRRRKDEEYGGIGPSSAGACSLCIISRYVFFFFFYPFPLPSPRHLPVTLPSLFHTHEGRGKEG